MKNYYDILIKKVLLVDGTGKPAFKSSLGIKDEKIVDIGDIENKADTERLIEGDGLVASPGFIDMHTHLDMLPLQYPLCESYIMQGITTTFSGHCGFTPAPLKNVYIFNWWEFDWWHEVAPYKYCWEAVLPLSKVNEKFKEKLGWEIDWRTFDEWLSKVEKTGISVNYIPLVGHHTIRATVMESDYKRRAKKQEIMAMKEYVDEAMRSGAFGLSTGLDYLPGSFADTEEIVELTKVVSKYGGLYATHTRSGMLSNHPYESSGAEGVRWNRVKGIFEAIEIGRRTKVPVEISHMSSAYGINPPPPPILQEAAAKATLQMVDEARKEGLDVNFDIIPNVTGGLLTQPNLISLLDPWLIELGSKEKLVENLKVQEFRDEIKEAIKAGKRVFYFIIKRNPYWMDNIKILRCKNKDYEGKSIGEIAHLKKIDPLDALFNILMEDPDTKNARAPRAPGQEIAKQVFLKHPASMIGIDTYALDTKFEINYPIHHSFLGHENTYGGYARYLGKYVRDLGILSLEEAIKKTTFMPAQKLKLNGRGVLKVGAYADIVVFDLEKIRARGDNIEPRVAPEGISFVMVNGKIVYEKGSHTGIRHGKVIRRKNPSF